MTTQAKNPIGTFFEPLKFLVRVGSPMPQDQAGGRASATLTAVLELIVNVYAAGGIFILLAMVAVSLKAALPGIHGGGSGFSFLKQGLAAASNILAIADLVLLLIFLFRTTRWVLQAPASQGILDSGLEAARPSLWCAFALGTALAFGAIIFLEKSPLLKPIPPPDVPRPLPVPKIPLGPTKAVQPEQVQPREVEPRRSSPTSPTDLAQPKPTPLSQTPADVEPFGVRVTLPDTPESEYPSASVMTALKDRGQQDFQLLLDQGVKFPAGLTIIRLIFTLKSDGSVDPDSIVIEKSSGNEEMDAAAKQLIRNGAFPAFPDSLRETPIKVEAEFSLRMPKNR